MKCRYSRLFQKQKSVGRTIDVFPIYSGNPGPMQALSAFETWGVRDKNGGAHTRPTSPKHLIKSILLSMNDFGLRYVLRRLARVVPIGRRAIIAQEHAIVRENDQAAHFKARGVAQACIRFRGLKMR